MNKIEYLIIWQCDTSIVTPNCRLLQHPVGRITQDCHLARHECCSANCKRHTEVKGKYSALL